LKDKCILYSCAYDFIRIVIDCNNDVI